MVAGSGERDNGDPRRACGPECASAFVHGRARGDHVVDDGNVEVLQRVAFVPKRIGDVRAALARIQAHLGAGVSDSAKAALGAGQGKLTEEALGLVEATAAEAGRVQGYREGGVYIVKGSGTRKVMGHYRDERTLAPVLQRMNHPSRHALVVKSWECGINGVPGPAVRTDRFRCEGGRASGTTGDDSNLLKTRTAALAEWSAPASASDAPFGEKEFKGSRAEGRKLPTTGKVETVSVHRAVVEPVRRSLASDGSRTSGGTIF